MRDYIVLWRQRDTAQVNQVKWFADDPGSGNDFGDPVPSVKTYVRVPDESLLLRWFNHDLEPYPSTSISENGVVFGWATMWGRQFGGNIIGGYDNLGAVPTSDAYGALHGRPARGENGQFIRSF